MFQWLLRGVLLIVVVVVIAIFVVMSSIDSAAKIAIEKGGTRALDVSTTLDDIRVGMLVGAVNMKQLEIGNPAGFETPHFFQLRDGNVSVTPRSLLGDLIELPELTLIGIDMHLEKRQGKANYTVILNNLKQFQSVSGKPTPADDAESHKYVIRKVVLRDITVQADLLPIGGKLTRIPIKIEAIELENVGADSDREVMMSELMGLLTHAILNGIVQKTGDLIPSDILGDLAHGLAAVEGLADLSVKVVGDITQGVAAEVGQITGEITKGVSNVTESVGKTLPKGISEGVKGIGGRLEDVGEHGGETLKKGLDGLFGERRGEPQK